MAGWLRESWRRLGERAQLWGCKREKLQEEVGQNQSFPDAMLTRIQESKVHLSEISVDVSSEGGQQESEDDIVTYIEESKTHWSEIPGDVRSEDGVVLDMVNSEICQRNVSPRNESSWKALQEHDSYFFQDWSKKVTIGQKIGEGGQAQIFEASWNKSNRMESKRIFTRWAVDPVVKMFKLEGCNLEDLIRQWPRISSSTTSQMDLEGCEQAPKFLYRKGSMLAVSVKYMVHIF